MIYNYENARGATVHDMDTGKKIGRVVSVDTEHASVEVTHDPVRVAEDGDTIVTETLRFRSVHAIQGMEPRPVLFHCYGRQA